MGSTKWSAGQQRHMLHENYKLWKEKYHDVGDGYVGLDFSMTATGLVRLDSNGDLVDHTTVKTSAKDGTTAQRLNQVTKDFAEILQDQGPKVVAFESVNVATHISSVKALSKVSGAFFQVLEDYSEVTPYVLSCNVSTLKTAATNDVKAAKSHMLLEVHVKWGERMNTDDEADAFVAAKLGSKIDDFFNAYEETREQRNVDLSDVLMDICKKRCDIFYGLCDQKGITKTEVNALIGVFTGSRNGGNGLKQLRENDTDFYYEARKRLKRI